MALFKKKKKKTIEEPEEPTQTIEANVGKEKKELSPEAKRLIELVKQYRQEYYGIFRKEDFLELNPDVEVVNILFAIFGELRTLNSLIKGAIDEE